MGLCYRNPSRDYRVQGWRFHLMPTTLVDDLQRAVGRGILGAPVCNPLTQEVEGQESSPWILACFSSQACCSQ